MPVSDEDKAKLQAELKVSAEDVNEASKMFDEMCQERLAIGAEEYGPMAFLDNDVLNMLVEELLDMANYARMQVMKILLINKLLNDQVEEKKGEFKKVGETWNSH